MSTKLVKFYRDKNLLCCELENGREYALDMNTGLYMNKKTGKNIKNLPASGRSIDNFSKKLIKAADLPYYVCFNYICNGALKCSLPDDTPSTMAQIFKGLELCLTLDFKLPGGIVPDYYQIGKNPKLFAKYVSSSSFPGKEASAYKIMEGFKEYQLYIEYPILQRFTEQEFQCVLRNKEMNNYLDIFDYYMHTQKMSIALGVTAAYSCIKKYIRYCQQMDYKPQKSNSPLKEFADIITAYKIYEEERQSNAFVKNYAKHEKAWDFTYDEFTILIPNKPNDLIQEGLKMHHCVGSYADEVVNNKTYICFVRRIDKPEEPYITCQVTTDGLIRQYHLAYNQEITREEDRAFRRAYQQYLISVW